MIWRGAAVILVVLLVPPLTAVALESFGDDAKGSPAPGANFDPASDDGFSGLVMSEGDVVQAAVDSSPELQRLRQRASARKVGADFAKYDVRNPELRIQDLSTEYFDSDANHRFQIGLRWHLPRFGEVGENVALARWEYQDACVDEFEYRVQVIGQARQAFFNVLLLKDEVAAAQRREALEARRVDVLSRLADLGTVPFVRSMKAQTSLLKARRDVASLQKALGAARQALAAIVGNDSPVDAAGFELPEGEPQLDAIMKRAESVRPELALEARRTELARASRRAEVLDMIPTFRFVQAAYHYESRDRDWGELSFGIEIPVFNWGRHKLRRAEMALASREDNGSAGIDQVRKRIGQDFAQASAARAAWVTLKDHVAKAREDVERMAAVARSKGISEEEVIDLELSGAELEWMMVDARREYVEALLDLCEAAGFDTFGELLGE